MIDTSTKLSLFSFISHCYDLPPFILFLRWKYVLFRSVQYMRRFDGYVLR